MSYEYKLKKDRKTRNEIIKKKIRLQLFYLIKKFTQTITLVRHQYGSKIIFQNQFYQKLLIFMVH